MPATNENTVFISLGNDPQMRLARGFFCRLRDPKFGAFSGRTAFASSGLSGEHIEELERLEIQAIVHDAKSCRQWEEQIASDSHPFGKVAKLILIRSALDQLDDSVEYFVFADPDIVCQKPASDVLDQIWDGQIFFAKEPVDLSTNPILFKWLARGSRENQEQANRIEANYTYELNTGFFASSISFGKTFLDKFIEWQLSNERSHLAQKSPEGLRGWHDQDFFRFYRLSEEPEGIGFLSSSLIYHLVGWANIKGSWKEDDQFFEIEEDKIRPNFVHFASCTQRAEHIWQD